MADVKSKALVLLHEEQFKKGKFFLHVELVAARQADNVRKKREKEGYKQLSIILGISQEFQLCPGEKVNISINGALKLAKSPKSDQMIIEFAEGNNCCRQFALVINESDKSSLAEVTFTRTKKNQFIFEATIDISDHPAKNKPTLQENDLGATRNSGTREYKRNISEEPDSLSNNNAQPNSPEDNGINKILGDMRISPTSDKYDSEHENTAPGSSMDSLYSQGKPVDTTTSRSKLSAYDKILSDHGLAVLSQALDPQSSWFLLVSLGLSNGAITKHETNNPHNITRARADALIEWRNNKKDKSNESLYYILIENLESTGRKDMVHHLKTVCKKDRYPHIADFQ